MYSLLRTNLHSRSCNPAEHVDSSKRAGNKRKEQSCHPSSRGASAHATEARRRRAQSRLQAPVKSDSCKTHGGPRHLVCAEQNKTPRPSAGTARMGAGHGAQRRAPAARACCPKGGGEHPQRLPYWDYCAQERVSQKVSKSFWSPQMWLSGSQKCAFGIVDQCKPADLPALLCHRTVHFWCAIELTIVFQKCWVAFVKSGLELGDFGACDQCVPKGPRYACAALQAPASGLKANKALQIPSLNMLVIADKHAYHRRAVMMHVQQESKHSMGDRPTSLQ